MNTLIKCIFIFTGLSGTAAAAVSPLVVSTEFHNENWFPLPEAQMKSAAVDTALMKISETGRFAFLYTAPDGTDSRAGALSLVVSLVEPAESAKITIRLNLPGNRGSFVSSASISLHGRDYKGIFDALQQLGTNGAEQITASLPEAPAGEAGAPVDDEIRRQIIDLNLHVIRLGNNISQLQQQAHDADVREQLGKLDSILARLDEQQAYAKRSDSIKNRKLDAIYAEIQKLNIGSNTDNRPPAENELSEYDLDQLPRLSHARKLKFDKNFIEARKVLAALLADPKISAIFHNAIKEELRINLPLYEAEIIRNEVSGSFMRYVKNDEYKSKLQHISRLYDTVLAEKDLTFKKRTEINQMKDQLNLTGESMTTAVTALRENSLHMLKFALRDALARHYTYRAMGMNKSGTGDCPDRESIEAVMKRSNVSNEIVSYKSIAQNCELVLKESADSLVVYNFSEEDASYEHRPR